MPMMISYTDRVVATNQGHAIEFKKNVPQHVPPRLVSYLLERGVVAADDDALSVIAADTAEPVLFRTDPTDPDKRVELLVEAMKKLSDEGRLDFTASNKPRQPSLAKTLGWSEVYAEERDLAWSIAQGKVTA